MMVKNLTSKKKFFFLNLFFFLVNESLMDCKEETPDVKQSSNPSTDTEQ